jgi:hypothetical protein
MSQEQIDYKSVRRRVEEGVKKEKNAARWVLFTFSVVITICLIAVGWGFAGSADLVRTDEGLVAIGFLTAASVISMLFQLFILSMDTKSGESSIRQRLMAQELSEEMLRLGAEDDVQQKQKRAMRLTEDGELEEIVEDEPADALLEDEPRITRSTK